MTQSNLIPLARTEPAGHRPRPLLKPDTPSTRLSTVTEVAKFMRVSKMTVYRLVDSKELPGYRIGRQVRIPTAAVWDYLRGALIDPRDLSKAKAL